MAPTALTLRQHVRRRLHQGLRGRLRALLSGGIHPGDNRLPDCRTSPGASGRFHHAARRLLAPTPKSSTNHGILLISAEVQTGWGRPASTSGHLRPRHHPRRDDIAKGLATLRHRRGRRPRRLLDGIRGNGHSTFGGQPGRDRGRQRHPRLPALPRPPAQRRRHRSLTSTASRETGTACPSSATSAARA